MCAWEMVRWEFLWNSHFSFLSMAQRQIPATFGYENSSALLCSPAPWESCSVWKELRKSRLFFHLEYEYLSQSSKGSVRVTGSICWNWLLMFSIWANELCKQKYASNSPKNALVSSRKVTDGLGTASGLYRPLVPWNVSHRKRLKRSWLALRWMALDSSPLRKAPYSSKYYGPYQLRAHSGLLGDGESKGQVAPLVVQMVC